MEQTNNEEGQQKEQKETEKKFTRKKETQEEKLSKIEVKSSEQTRLDHVFQAFCAYEDEPSSDEDSKEKRYKKQIEERANAKKMKKPTSTFVSQTMKKTQKKKQKKKEDDDMEPEEKKSKEKKKRFSFKAIRKTLRNLCEEYAKDDITQMIWEVDENSDGYVSEDEFMNMYKKCIVDEKEEEGKKLFYLVQFLMYDIEDKHFITVEDTLEILCARNQQEMDNTIDAIFDVEEKLPNGKTKKKKRDKLTFLEYAQRMHEISMKKRNEISNRKKLFCQKLKEDAINKNK